MVDNIAEKEEKTLLWSILPFFINVFKSLSIEISSYQGWKKEFLISLNSSTLYHTIQTFHDPTRESF